MKDAYKQAYLREKQARQEAESLLEEKSRVLYLAKQELVELNASLMSHNRELILSEKLASLGRLAAGVAHEIKNPLSYVKSNIDFIEKALSQRQEAINNYIHSAGDASEKKNLEILSALISVEESDDLVELFFDIKRGLERIGEISSTMTGFSHKKKEEEGLVDINFVINDALKILRDSHSSNTKVDFKPGNIPLVHGHESDFNQIFLNIISNAYQSINTKTDGILNIQTGIENKSIYILVIDNGDGMDRATIDKIFDPFFTTKPVGEGTGLGLYVAYQKIESSGGSIKVESKIGKGTKFILSFPLGK